MTHAPIDWRLRCNLEGATEHRWDQDCAHTADPASHPYRCCLHTASKNNPCTCDHERPDGEHVRSPGCLMCEWC